VAGSKRERLRESSDLLIDAAKVSALVDKIMTDAGEPAIGGDGEKDEPPQPKVIPGQVVPTEQVPTE